MQIHALPCLFSFLFLFLIPVRRYGASYVFEAVTLFDILSHGVYYAMK